MVDARFPLTWPILGASSCRCATWLAGAEACGTRSGGTLAVVPARKTALSVEARSRCGAVGLNPALGTWADVRSADAVVAHLLAATRVVRLAAHSAVAVDAVGVPSALAVEHALGGVDVSAHARVAGLARWALSVGAAGEGAEAVGAGLPTAAVDVLLAEVGCQAAGTSDACLAWLAVTAGAAGGIGAPSGAATPRLARGAIATFGVAAAPRTTLTAEAVRARPAHRVVLANRLGDAPSILATFAVGAVRQTGAGRNRFGADPGAANKTRCAVEVAGAPRADDAAVWIRPAIRCRIGGIDGVLGKCIVEGVAVVHVVRVPSRVGWTAVRGVTETNVPDVGVRHPHVAKRIATVGGVGVGIGKRRQRIRPIGSAEPAPAPSASTARSVAAATVFAGPALAAECERTAAIVVDTGHIADPVRATCRAATRAVILASGCRGAHAFEAVETIIARQVVAAPVDAQPLGAAQLACEAPVVVEAGAFDRACAVNTRADSAVDVIGARHLVDRSGARFAPTTLRTERVFGTVRSIQALRGAAAARTGLARFAAVIRSARTTGDLV